MSAQLNFNATEVEEINFDPIPAGIYKAAIVSSDSIVPKSGDGSMLKLVLQVLEGEYAGRQIFENLCLEHSNEQAVKIARSKLKGFCEAVDVPILNDSSQLHDIPFLADITVQPGKGDYGPSNRIRKVTQISAAPAAKKATPTAGVVPWGKKK